MTPPGSHDVARKRASAKEAAQHLADLLAPATEFERLVDGYLETKQTLAQALRTISQEELGDTSATLEDVKQRVVAHMKSALGNVVPEQYLHATGYGTIHGVLLTYLVRHLGDPVPASRLRVLTGDQVHTERRVRELRDLGLNVSVSRAGGENQYVLASLDPDLAFAASTLAGHNIKADATLSSARKAELLAIVQPEN
jgi:hypothetical protein